MGAGGDFSLASMAAMTASAAGSMAKAAGMMNLNTGGPGGGGGLQDDLIFSALDMGLNEDDDILSSLGQLIMDDEVEPAKPKASSGSTWGSGSFGLLTPDQVSKNATTKVAGVSTASIWGTIDKAPVAAPPTAAAVPPAAAAGPALTLAEIEAKLRASNAAVPANVAAPVVVKKGPPGLTQPTANLVARGSPASKRRTPAAAVPANVPAPTAPVAAPAAAPLPPPTAAPAAAEAPPVIPARAGGDSKPTPILAQLRQAQDQHQMQQQLGAEQGKFGTHMQQLAAQLKASHDQIQFHQTHAAQANMALMAMASQVQAQTAAGKALPEGLDQQRQALEQRRGQSAGAVHEHQRRIHQIVQAQGAAEREFATRQTAIAINTGNSKIYRGMLENQLQQIKHNIKQTIDVYGQSSTLIKSLEARRLETAANLTSAPADQVANGQQLIQKMEQQLAALAQRQAMVQQQQAALAGQEQMIYTQIQTVEATLADTGNAEYNNLMAASEKKWLISIQARQMHGCSVFF
jgi:hypothetical protein